MSDNSSKMDDPLLAQASDNKNVTDDPVKQSGSAPKTDSEHDKAPKPEKNIIETKLEKAFGKEEHEQEISGAGVGSHPKF